MNTPIILENFFYRKLVLEWIDGDFEEKTPIKIDFSFDPRCREDNKDKILMRLGVDVSPVEPFQGIKASIIIDGFFELTDMAKKSDHLDYYAYVNTSTILYGILRGQIGMMTNNFPSGSLLLPTVVMNDEVEKFIAIKNKHNDTRKIAANHSKNQSDKKM